MCGFDENHAKFLVTIFFLGGGGEW